MAARSNPFASFRVNALGFYSQRMWILRRYWGFAVLALAIGAVVNNWLGPPILIFFSTAATYYFLFQVPNWCGALNRNETFCRENSSGLMLGCYRRQHKWQKIKLAFMGAYWQRLASELRTQPLEGVKTVTALLGFAGGLITLLVGLVKLAEA